LNREVKRNKTKRRRRETQKFKAIRGWKTMWSC